MYIGIVNRIRTYVVDANSRLSGQSAADSLPSWNEGSAKIAILSFVANVANESNPDYVIFFRTMLFTFFP